MESHKLLVKVDHITQCVEEDQDLFDRFLLVDQVSIKTAVMNTPLTTMRSNCLNFSCV